MFIEPTIGSEKRGWIEVICGSMFSGKTEELIRRLKRAKIANLDIEIFKPAMDQRFHESKIVSHDTNMVQARIVANSEEIMSLANGMNVVGMDEVQFFDKGIVDVCEQLALKGVRVIAAGLDMDYSGKPFGPVPDLLAVADYITKVHAICVKCGNIANISYRKTSNEEQVFLGASDYYEPRCRKCYHESE